MTGLVGGRRPPDFKSDGRKIKKFAVQFDSEPGLFTNYRPGLSDSGELLDLLLWSSTVPKLFPCLSFQNVINQKLF